MRSPPTLSPPQNLERAPGERSTILHIYCPLGKKYNLTQILRIGEVQSCANVGHILRIREISTILRKSCAYIVHWGKKYNLAQILPIYCVLGRESCAYIGIDKRKS